MPYTTWREAVRTYPFRGQLIFNMLFNFGINFGFSWGTLSKYGKIPKDEFADLYFSQWNSDLGTCVVYDLIMTCALLPFFLTFFGSGAVKKDIEDKKLEPVASSVITQGWWLWTPVRFRSLFIRSIAASIFFTALIGVPTIILFAIGLGSSRTISGLGFVIFKGFWAMLLAAPVYFLAFFGAADERNFPSDTEHLFSDKKSAEEVPLVGNVGKI